MRIPSVVLFALAVATPCMWTRAQSAPSVLDLQRSYHVGVYSATIDVPSGAASLLAQVGGLDLLPSGTISGAFDTWEVTAGGTTFTPNDPFAGTCIVRPDGTAVFDLDPTNPGTSLVRLWIAPDGSLFHTARATPDPEALSVLAIAKSSGQTLASLNGTFHYRGHHLRLVGGALATTSSWGIATFDGVGGFTATGMQMSTTALGTTTTPDTSSGSYTVAADGALTIGGDRGGMSADGQVLFGLFANTTGSELGLTIAVRIGPTYDFNDLHGRFSVHGQGYTLGQGPSLPRSATQFGEFAFTATSASTGSWSTGGVLVEGSPQGPTQNPWIHGGAAALGATGTLSLTSPAGAIELDVSANGRYFVGRELGTHTNLLFGVRQCAVAAPYGLGTAGAGGRVPVLGMKTFPLLGNGNWALWLGNGLGGGLGLIPISLAPLPGVPALGGLIHVDPVAVGIIPLVLLGGGTGVPGAGQAQTTLALPATPSLAGLQLFAQGLILDAAAPGGFAMSNGFRAELSR